MGLLIMAVFAWGFSNFFFKLARFRVDAISALFWEGTALMIVIPVIVAIRTGFVVSRDPVGIAWSLAGGASVILGGWLFLEALGKIPLAIAMPFSALNVLVSALLGILILGERLSPLHTAGAIGMIISAMLLSMPQGN